MMNSIYLNKIKENFSEFKKVMSKVDAEMLRKVNICIDALDKKMAEIEEEYSKGTDDKVNLMIINYADVLEKCDEKLFSPAIDMFYDAKDESAQKILNQKLIEWGTILKKHLTSDDDFNIVIDISDEDGYACMLALCIVRGAYGKSAPIIVGTSERKDYLKDVNKSMRFNYEAIKNEPFFCFDIPVANKFPYIQNCVLAFDNHMNLKDAPECRTNVDRIFGTDKGRGKLKENYNLGSIHLVLASLKAVGIDVFEYLKRMDDKDGFWSDIKYRMMYDLLTVGDSVESTLVGYNKCKEYPIIRSRWLKRLGLNNVHIEDTFLRDEVGFVFCLNDEDVEKKTKDNKKKKSVRQYFIDRFIKEYGGSPEMICKGTMICYELEKASVNKDKDKLIQIYLNNNSDKKKHYGEGVNRVYTL